MAAGQLKYKDADAFPFCVLACPAGINIPRYIRFISEGKFAAALAVIREKIPFPSVCGYVCTHPCEDACQANKKLAKPLAIKALKRFVAENSGSHIEIPIAASSGKQIAVVGSGPAGLTAAYYLAKRGHRVTVFESLPQAGGMMRFGIPRFRLPEEIIDNEINAIKEAGVSLKTGSRVDSLDELWQKGYDAIFLATGAYQSVKLDIDGEDDAGVIDCIDFLRDINSGKKVKLGRRVAVIGGGNAAIDSARSAFRLGIREVTILYRRSRVEMPARPEEVEQAIEEGVRIDFLVAPIRIIRNNELKLECVRMKLGRPDASGRPRPEPVGGSEFISSFDNIITAVGQVVALPPDFGLPKEPGGAIQVDPATLETPSRGVFAGGDAVSGPASVIAAIADGRKVASSIDRYLGGSGDIEEKLAPAEGLSVALQGFPLGERNEGDLSPAAERRENFAVVELGFATEDEAINEAKRCLRCDLPITIDAIRCSGCSTCGIYCSLVNLNVLSPMKAYVKVGNTFDEANTISFTDDCDNCGICARYCPYGAIVRHKDQEVAR